MAPTSFAPSMVWMVRINVWPMRPPAPTTTRPTSLFCVSPLIGVLLSAILLPFFFGDDIAVAALQLIKAGIDAVLDADQIVVTPFFHHTTSFHHHDAICIDHRGKTMGDHDCGAVLHDAFQRLLDPLLRFVVEGGSRFV